jgi:hypothetical protein
MDIDIKEDFLSFTIKKRKTCQEFFGKSKPFLVKSV